MKSSILSLAIAALAGFALAAEREKGELKDPDDLADHIIRHCDEDKNGTISRKEFALSPICQEIRKKHGAEEVAKQFADADNNNDGELTKNELSRMDAVKTVRGLIASSRNLQAQCRPKTFARVVAGRLCRAGKQLLPGQSSIWAALPLP